jgi:DNA polymerase-4
MSTKPYDLVLRGGTVATSSAVFPADVAIDGILNADTFESATVSAAFGGTTTVISFAAQHIGLKLEEVVDAYHALAKTGAVIDYALTALAWNRDPREIKTHRRARSVGAQSALGRKPAEERVFRPTLRHLADRIGTRLRAKSRPGRTVTVRVRFADLHSVTRSVTLDAPISATAILAEIAEELVRTVLADHPDEKTISLLAISVSHLETHWDVQLELPLGLEDEERRPGTKRGVARSMADRAVDRIRDRFGWEAVGYGSVALGLSRSVPDEFRELAGKDL